MYGGESTASMAQAQQAGASAEHSVPLQPSREALPRSAANATACLGASSRAGVMTAAPMESLRHPAAQQQAKKGSRATARQVSSSKVTHSNKDPACILQLTCSLRLLCNVASRK